MDEDIDSVFSLGAGDRQGSNNQNGGATKIGDSKIGDPFPGSEWKDSDIGSSDIFSGVHGGGGDELEVEAEDFKPWDFTEEGKGGSEEDVFGVEADSVESGLGDLGDGLGEGIEKSERDIELEAEEKALSDVLKGGLLNPVLIILLITLCNIYIFIGEGFDIVTCFYFRLVLIRKTWMFKVNSFIRRCFISRHYEIFGLLCYLNDPVFCFW